MPNYNFLNLPKPISPGSLSFIGHPGLAAWPLSKKDWIFCPVSSSDMPVWPAAILPGSTGYLVHPTKDSLNDCLAGAIERWVIQGETLDRFCGSYIIRNSRKYSAIIGKMKAVFTGRIQRGNKKAFFKPVCSCSVRNAAVFLCPVLSGRNRAGYYNPVTNPHMYLVAGNVLYASCLILWIVRNSNKSLLVLWSVSVAMFFLIFDGKENVGFVSMFCFPFTEKVGFVRFSWYISFVNSFLAQNNGSRA